MVPDARHRDALTLPFRFRPSPVPSLSSPHRPAVFLAAIAIIAATWLAYANSLHVPFVFDDELAIVGNPSLQRLTTALFPPEELSGLPISGRPLVNASFALNHAISGQAVWSYHVGNILVHAAASLLLFGLVRRTLTLPRIAGRFATHATPLALLASLLWSLHPLQTESVTYISQRAEALLGLWYLGALYAFVRGATSARPVGWYATGALACLAGTFTKEVIVSAPLCVALYARVFLGESWRDVGRRFGLPLLGYAASWLALGWVVANEGGARGVSAGFGLGVSPWTYLLTQCQAIVLYVKLSLWPHPLVLDYGIGTVRSVGDVWWQGLCLLGALGAAIVAVVRARPWGWLVASCFLILAPTSSFLPLVGQTMAEHRMYLPEAGVVTALILAAYLLLGGRAIVVAGLLVIGAGALTARRNEDYATPIRICTDTVTKRPANGRAMALLGDYLQRAGRLDEARRWLERSLIVEPGVVPVLNNLGDVWQRLDQPAKAADCFRAALVHRPTDAKLLNNLGNALILAGRAEEGIAQLEAAVRAAPSSTLPRQNLAAALARAGRANEAAEQFAALIRQAPGDAEVRADYADLLAALHRTNEALEQLQASVALKPEDGELRGRLGVALGRSGKLREALEQFEAALRINPRDASAQQNAAIARRRLGIR